MMCMRSIPHSMTSGSFANTDKNSRPKISSSPPSSEPTAKEYTSPTT